MTLAEALERAGLTGRGGAAFSTAVKVHAAHAAGARLIVNACDGELGAAKDADVVAHHLEELDRGARLVAGRRVRYAAHRGSVTAGTLRRAGLDVLEVPSRYVSSEESALVSAAAGAPARPLAKRLPIVYGAALPGGGPIPPTVVLNAETVWRIAQIHALGVEWFRSFGTPDEPGPRLVTVTGAVHAPGTVATAAGTPLREILAAAGGTDGPPGAVAVSGLSSGWLTPREAAGARWSNHDLRSFGITTGAGAVHVLRAGECPLGTVRSWLTYAAGETAGQCGPCMVGVPAVAAELVSIIDGRPVGITARELRDRIDLLDGRGACRFPDGVATFARSVLRAFPEELAAHAAGACPAGARRVTAMRPHAAAA